MSRLEIQSQIKQLALDEVHRIYGLTNPGPEMIRDMMDVIEGWPMIQAVLGSKK